MSDPIKMVLLLRGDEPDKDTTVKFSPGEWDPDTRQGKLLKDVPLHEFVEQVITQMDSMSASYVMEHAKLIRDMGIPQTPEYKHDLFLRLLASFSELPIEVIGNMLAGMLVGCVDDFSQSDEFDELYSQLTQP